MALNLVGQTFGRLSVKQLAKEGKHRRWLCLCTCGTQKEVAQDHLRSGATVSCGCYNREQNGKAHTVHGGTKTKAHGIWKAMLNRVRSGHPDYGGRGISVDPEWQKFELFFRDMGECPSGYSIEREDVNGNYCKANCKWIPLKDQNKNKRNSVYLYVDGVKMLSADASRLMGIPQSTLCVRLKRHGINDYIKLENHTWSSGRRALPDLQESGFQGVTAPVPSQSTP